MYDAVSKVVVWRIDIDVFTLGSESIIKRLLRSSSPLHFWFQIIETMRVVDGVRDGETPSLSIWCTFLLLALHTVGAGRTNPSRTQSPEGEGQTEAIQRLSRVFRIDRVPMRIFNRSPPQYMTELFKNITDRGGLMRMGSPYNANTVRSLPDRGE